MDFFANQDAARRRSGLMIFYFVLAVFTIVVAMYLAACLITPMLSSAVQNESGSYSATGTQTGSSYAAANTEIHFWQPHLLLFVGGGTLLVIGLGSLYKIAELRGGGAKVATMLGGRLIAAQTTDPGERRLLNVVQEMALASGTPVPPVYVLEGEESINAFAAGSTPADAVIGVNRGTIKYLSRDELQGVMAHEFSHILNGDMRTNIRLMGVLNGILLIAVIGFYALRVGSLSGGRSRDKNNAGVYIMLAGVAALIIGSIGLIFARLIKATLSREREYLADASAVQFTRNPDGIAGALKKIGGLLLGSRVQAAEAESTSHMFFGNARRASHFSSFSTHPPLKKRIAKIDPQFDGRFPRVSADSDPEGKDVKPKEPSEKPKAAAASPLRDFPVMGRLPLTAAIALGAIGEPTEQHVAQSRQLLENLPASLKEATAEPYSAQALVFGLLLEQDQEIQARQREIIASSHGDPAAALSLELRGEIDKLEPRYRLTAVDMVQSPLSQLSAEQYQSFRTTITKLVEADEQIDLFEFMLQRVLIERLDRALLGKKPPANRYRALGPLLESFAHMMSVLAHAGDQNEEAAATTYEQAMRPVFTKQTLPAILPRNECSLTVVGDALAKLAQASPTIKKRILEAAIKCVAADGEVTLAEAELVRAIAADLDCPLPPITVGQIRNQ